MLTQRIKEKVLLNTYAKNLTEEYRLKAEDKAPIIGREEETRRCIEVLSKKYKNNVILVGKPGIGKTALVESIAKKLALGDVPSTLKDKELYEVDLQLLSAPNEDHGGPKKRLKQFIAEVEELNGDVILFIDEVHIIMGGEAEGAMDISNTLKPSLARTNGISVIGATTPYEFHKYMEKDGAITRRFSRINMAEPTPDQAKSILRGRRRGLEIFYGVTVSDAAVDLAVDLSVRYIPSRQLPDKAIDLLDQACASVRVSIDAMPPALDLMQNMIAVRQEELIGEKDPENRARIQEVIDSLEPQFQEQYALWQQQKVTIEDFKEFRVKLEELRNNIEAEQAKEILDAALIADLEKRYKANEINLEQAKQRYRQMPNLLIDDLVGEDAVRVTLQGMTGIPLSEISADEKERMRLLEDKLHEGVIGQDAAVHEVAYAIKRNRLGLGDPTQPMGSFLFLGSSGSGKALTYSTTLPAVVGGKQVIIRHGDLKVGDYVFDRTGKPTLVTGVYPQGKRLIYRVTLADGRTVDADGDHLWSVVTPKMKEIGRDCTPRVMTTKEMLQRGVRTESKGAYRYMIPANGPVQRPEADLPVDPYLVGVMIGDGCAREVPLTISSDDEFVIAKVASIISASHYKQSKHSYSWTFHNPMATPPVLLFQTADVLSELPELRCYAGEKRIPEAYLMGSIAQRMALVNGLFDTDGSADSTDRCRVTYSTTSKGLADDVQRLLWSLGYPNSITMNSRPDKTDEYTVRVRATFEDKVDLFSLPRKRDVITRAIANDKRVRVKTYDWIPIRSIEVMDEREEMNCIMVDNDEHLYQLENGVVTHNTELVKQLAHVMFGNRDSMVRIDMGEYKSPASISRLIGAPPGEDKDNQGGYLTEAIKNNPYSIVLFDEAEKAHPAIFDLMLAMLDDGEITDSRGEKVDFRNTIIVLTSNIGSAKILRGVDKHTGKLDPRVEAEVNAMLRNPDRENGGKGFKPEFLNRLDATVVFIPLTREEIERIADIKLNGLRRRLMESRKIRLVYSERIPLNFREADGPRVDVSYWLAQQYTHDELNLGGRPLNRYIRRYIEDKLVDMLLEEDVPDGACIYIQAKYPPGPRTTVGEDGIERPVQPIIDFKQVTEAEYDLLIKRDPIFKG